MSKKINKMIHNNLSKFFPLVDMYQGRKLCKIRLYHNLELENWEDVRFY